MINENIKEFFEDGALYTSVFSKTPYYAFQSTQVSIKEIDKFCEVCNTSKPFHNINQNPIVLFLKADCYTETRLVNFKCVSCANTKEYWLFNERTEEDDQILRLTKIGEYPQNKLKFNKDLSKFFKDDKKEYDKAVVCIHHGFGVAAFTYMRRIVEKNIDKLLDLISSDDMADPTIITAISELKKESPMSSKIAIANTALPPYLIISGHNPLGGMYKVLSEGVHTFTDEECLIRAKTVQKCMEFIIAGLATHRKSREEFKDNLNLLRTL